MKEKGIEEYVKALRALKDVNVNEDKYKIIEDPEKYFEPYLSGVTDLPSLNLIQLDIYKILKNVVNCTGTKGNDETKYFISKYTIKEYTQILIDFYTYTLSLITDLINNSSDALLDAYNQKFLDEESLKVCMKKIETIKPTFNMDKEDVENCIKEMNQMLEQLD